MKYRSHQLDRVNNGHGVARSGESDESLERRIGERIKPLPNGCWAYQGKLTQRAMTAGATGPLNVYRWVYETMVGPIPEGYVVHHECENPGCVNPAHLTPLTPSEHSSVHATLRRVRSV